MVCNRVKLRERVQLVSKLTLITISAESRANDEATTLTSSKPTMIAAAMRVDVLRPAAVTNGAPLPTTADVTYHSAYDQMSAVAEPDHNQLPIATDSGLPGRASSEESQTCLEHQV